MRPIPVGHEETSTAPDTTPQATASAAAGGLAAEPVTGAGEGPNAAAADREIDRRPAGPPDPERRARLRLASIPGLGPGAVARLLACLGSARAVLRERPETLASVPGMGATRACLVAAAPSEDAAERDLARAAAAGANVLFPGDDAWPGALGDLRSPPNVLFVRGDLARALAPVGAPGAVAAALGGRGVAVVGSRRASAYGLAMARSIATGLAAAGVPVVSGLARGIDGAAHRAALDANGTTVGVLGGGMARFYPPEHVPLARAMVAAGGAVVSEFPLDVPPLPHHFPRRNRLIAALSAAVVIVEAAEGSGSLGTAEHALDIGREVLAVPGRADHPNARGVHRLLREGAGLCESAEDVLRALGLEIERPAEAGHDGAPATSDPVQSAILAALTADELDADALVAATAMDPAAVLGALTELELTGRVRVGPDGRYGMER